MRAMAGELAGDFRAIGRAIAPDAVAGRVDDALAIAASMIVSDVGGTWERRTRAAVEAGLEYGHDMAEGLTGAQVDSHGNLVAEFIRLQVDTVVPAETVSMLASLEPAITAAVGSRETIDATAATIMREAGMGESRAFRIARTEVLAGHNYGTHVSARDSLGTRFAKVWLSSLDRRTRQDHLDMHDHAVPMESLFAFPDGSHLEFPGDRRNGANASQVVNCRCTLTYRPPRR